MLDAGAGEPLTVGIGPPTAPQVSAEADADFDPFPELESTPPVPEAVVRGILATAGSLLGVSPLADPDVAGHWHFTDEELDALTPPMTRVVNARPQLRAAAARGDELTIAVQLLGYGGRNFIIGSMARRARAAQTEEWEHHGRVGEAEPVATGADATVLGPDGRFGPVGHGLHGQDGGHVVAPAG